MAKRYWLMKSEPDAFGIADLERKQTEPWTGVRNFMARNYMRQMSVGDEVLFYHSNAEPPGVAGLARVIRTGVVDDTQFDPESPYYDPKATRAQPRWDCVDVAYVRTFANYVPLERLRGEPPLADMLVIKRGMRLSVQPVDREHFDYIVGLSETAWSAPPKPPKPRKPPKPPKPPKLGAKPKGKATARKPRR
ncbi:MAG: EVE domain-containing protein [Deltaproteobacteria bacterium]|nr:EVE domain-containing protein [Deltaproteobacteria bacterium]